MGNCLSILRKAIGQNIDVTPQGHVVDKSKKQGVLWALAATVTGLAVVLFSTLTVVGAALAISAFVTGAGAALGVFQLFNTITNLFAVIMLTYVMANCIKNAQYHLSGRKISHFAPQPLYQQLVQKVDHLSYSSSSNS